MGLHPNNLLLQETLQRRDEEMRVTAKAATPVLAALALTGCAGIATESTPTQETSTATEPSTTQAPEAIETDEPSATETIDEGVAEAEAAPVAPKVPANVAKEDPDDVEILWEALMGSDGEYAAAASYQAVLDKYGQVEPYATILQAELRHIDALIRQLDRLGVDVPANPYLGKIAAPADLRTAAEAWAEGEVLNVALYDELMEQTEDAQILKVLGNLRRASLESHLPAFQRVAANGGTLDSMP